MKSILLAAASCALLASSASADYLIPKPPNTLITHTWGGTVDGVTWEAGWSPDTGDPGGEILIGFSATISAYTAQFDFGAYYPGAMANLNSIAGGNPNYPGYWGAPPDPSNPTTVAWDDQHAIETLSGTVTMTGISSLVGYVSIPKTMGMPPGPPRISFLSLTDPPSSGIASTDSPEPTTAALISLGLLGLALLRLKSIQSNT